VRRPLRARPLALGVSFALVASAVGCETPYEPFLGGPLTLVIVAGGDTQTVTVNTAVPVRPTVRVVNASGTPVAGVRVVFAPTKGQGLVFNSSPITDADGFVRVSNWIASTVPGPQEMVGVVSQNSILSTATFHLVAVPGPAVSATLNLDTANVGIGGMSVPLVMTEFDQFGNLIGPSASLTVVSEHPSIASVTGSNEVQGVAAGRTAVLVSNGTVEQPLLVIVDDDTRAATFAAAPDAWGVAVSSQGVAYAP
jgi:hypothetical protein